MRQDPFLWASAIMTYPIRYRSSSDLASL